MCTSFFLHIYMFSDFISVSFSFFCFWFSVEVMLLPFDAISYLHSRITRFNFFSYCLRLLYCKRMYVKLTLFSFQSLCFWYDFVHLFQFRLNHCRIVALLNVAFSCLIFFISLQCVSLLHKIHIPVFSLFSVMANKLFEQSSVCMRMCIAFLCYFTCSFIVYKSNSVCMTVSVPNTILPLDRIKLVL